MLPFYERLPQAHRFWPKRLADVKRFLEYFQSIFNRGFYSEIGRSKKNLLSNPGQSDRIYIVDFRANEKEMEANCEEDEEQLL